MFFLVLVIESNLINLANDYARLHQISQKSDQELKIQLEGARKDFTRIEERVRAQDVSLS